jgi:hypothetical protein
MSAFIHEDSISRLSSYSDTPVIDNQSFYGIKDEVIEYSNQNKNHIALSNKKSVK